MDERPARGLDRVRRVDNDSSSSELLLGAPPELVVAEQGEEVCLIGKECQLERCDPTTPTDALPLGV